jgi:hypothetical protein
VEDDFRVAELQFLNTHLTQRFIICCGMVAAGVICLVAGVIMLIVGSSG